jgi:hypothetical protein
MDLQTEETRRMEPKKMTIVIVIITLLGITFGIVLACYFSGTTSEKPLHAADPTTLLPSLTEAAPSPAILPLGTPAPQPSPQVNITEENATALVMEDYPMYYSIAAVSLTDRDYGKLLYEFTLVPESTAPFNSNLTAYVNAATGDLYTPLQDQAGITIYEAKARARLAFPQGTVDRVQMKYNDGSRFDRSWEFRLYSGDKELVHGGLSPDNGVLDWYTTGGETRFGRPESPVVSLDAAEKTARAEIQNRTGNSAHSLLQSRYDSLGMPDAKIAGEYVFLYKNDRPGRKDCENDGFTLVVDSVSGRITEYRRTWTRPQSYPC